jgi:hypothetical protein
VVLEMREILRPLVVRHDIGYAEALQAGSKTLTRVAVILAHAPMARMMQELL